MGFSIDVSIPVMTVFLQGIISFFSPCVLPLIPLYIGYLSGGTGVRGEDGRIYYKRSKVMLHTVCFVIGVSFAFFLLGLGFSALGSFFKSNQLLFARVGGILVVLFGLYQLGVFGTSSVLGRERRLPFSLNTLAMSSTGAGRKAKSRKLVCGGYKLYGRKECTNHFLDYELLYRVVLQEIRSLLSFTESEKEEIEETLREPVSPGEMQGEEKAVFSLKKRKKKLGYIIEKLYEDRVNGRISEERFYIMLDSCEKEEKKIAESLALLERPCSLDQESEPASDCLLSSLLKDISQEKGLSSDLLGKFIDRIEIFQSSEGGEGKAGRKYQTIRIYYKVAPIEDRNGLA